MITIELSYTTVHAHACDIVLNGDYFITVLSPTGADDYEIDVDDIVTVYETPDADEFMKQRGVLLHTDEVGLMSAFNRIWLFDDHIELVDDDGERFHIPSTTVSDIVFATFDAEQ